MVVRVVIACVHVLTVRLSTWIGIVHKASLLYNFLSSKPCLQFVVD